MRGVTRPRGRRFGRLGHGLAEHALAGLARLAGRRYFDARHFDRVYHTADPWDYATSDYETTGRLATRRRLRPERQARRGDAVAVGWVMARTKRRTGARRGPR